MLQLANICPHLHHLELSKMNRLTEEGQLAMFSLCSQIIQENPPLTVLSMYKFSKNNYFIENINMGKLVLETLLSSTINSITDLNLADNESWFWHSPMEENSQSNVDRLLALISK